MTRPMLPGSSSFLLLFALFLSPGRSVGSNDIQVSSPNGRVRFTLFARADRLSFGVTLAGKSVLEPSPMEFTLDGVNLMAGAEVGLLEPYQFNESYRCWGGHTWATNHYTGAMLSLRHPSSNTSLFLEVRAFDDALAFRYVVPGGAIARVPDEATTFVVPTGSTVWFHDLVGHYEGVHVKQESSEIKEGKWAGPPVTFKLPGGVGYAALTEAALVNYSGMALQADGQRGFRIRLGHSQPPSHPYLLRYGTNEAVRLSRPAAISGPILTPWRVVLLGADLDTLVNCDAIQNLCPPPDSKLFPNAARTDWVRPGRAVWKYLDDGGSNSLPTMKEFTRLAGELGFEYNVLEGFWSRWSDTELKELVAYGNQRHVGIWLWKHSKSLREPQARHEFFKLCHDVGAVGAKIDFFDHEAKEVIDLYQSLLREAAEYHLLLDFHGANKPAGESRTWPNQLTREAVKGMEASRLEDRATHDTTLPFTRLLAGPADYTPMHFGARRGNTTPAHQIASAAIFSGPLLTYAAHPATILTNPCCGVIKSIPATWDQTLVLPPSEIGELAVFARRTGRTWFLAVMNGATARKVKIPLSFLGGGEYRATLVRDQGNGAAAQTDLDQSLNRTASLTLDLSAGGGFVGRFSP